MSEIDSILCLLCGNDKFVPVFEYYEPDQYEKSVGVTEDGYYRSWVQCQNCELYASRYSRPRSKLDALYSTIYRNSDSSWRSEDSRVLFDKVAQLPFEQSETKQRINWIKNTLNLELKEKTCLRSAPYHLLDIGGGTGVFAYEFRDSDWIPHVIDPDENGSFLEKEFGIDYICEPYSAKHYQCKFDLISLVYVLEHIHNPEYLLTEIRSNLQDDGCVFIEVPNAKVMNELDSSNDIFNSCHLWFFSEETIGKLLRKTGFELMKSEQTTTVRGIQCLMVLASWSGQ